MSELHSCTDVGCIFAPLARAVRPLMSFKTNYSGSYSLTFIWVLKVSATTEWARKELVQKQYARDVNFVLCVERYPRQSRSFFNFQITRRIFFTGWPVDRPWRGIEHSWPLILFSVYFFLLLYVDCVACIGTFKREYCTILQTWREIAKLLSVLLFRQAAGRK